MKIGKTQKKRLVYKYRGKKAPTKKRLKKWSPQNAQRGKKAPKKKWGKGLPQPQETKEAPTKKKGNGPKNLPKNLPPKILRMARELVKKKGINPKGRTPINPKNRGKLMGPLVFFGKRGGEWGPTPKE